MPKDALTAIARWTVAILMISGCHPISSNVRETVDPSITYTEVRANPEVHRGSSLLLGGLVLGHLATEQGSRLEIMRWRLDPWGEPVAVDEEASRFLLDSEAPLDPAAFGPGRLVTLVGYVTGEETHQLGQNDYTYPVFHLREIHLWDTPFRYGLHRSTTIYAPTYVERPGRTNPYDPGYYAYPYTPYWLRTRSK